MLTFVLRVLGPLFAIAGVVGVVAEICVRFQGRAGALLMSAFLFAVGMGLMFAKPMTRAEVEYVFERWR